MTISRKPYFSNLTSMGVGGHPRELYEPGSFSELCDLLGTLEDPFILGGGCNTIFPDGDFNRPVIRTKKLGRLHVEEDGRVYAEAGVNINRIIRQTVKAGLGGLAGREQWDPELSATPVRTYSVRPVRAIESLVQRTLPLALGLLGRKAVPKLDDPRELESLIEGEEFR